MLENINFLRNRIAHHEPICFDSNSGHINTSRVEYTYLEIKELLRWMDIEPDILLSEIDNFQSVCDQIKKVQ
jgi:hypothetical protein